MSYPIFLADTEEYVVASVTSDVTLNTQTVVISINGTDYPATWTGAAGLIRDARTSNPVDFTGWADNIYKLEVRIEDSPEIPIVDAGYIRVKSPIVPVQQTVTPGAGLNGPRVNTYAYTSTAPAHSTVIEVTSAPTFDNAVWGTYGGMDLVEFGEWVIPSGGTYFYWRPFEEGTYLCVLDLSLQLSTNTTGARMRVRHSASPQDLWVNPIHNWTFQPFSTTNVFNSTQQRLDIPQNAIDAGQAYYYADLLWNRAATESCNMASWYFTIMQLSPGAASNIYPEL